jgi:hypothetical protein
MLDQLARHVCSGENLLEVVEHEQQVAMRQRTSQLRGWFVGARLAEVESPGDRRGHVVGHPDTGQIDEDGTVGQVGADPSGHLDREPRLPDAPRSGDGHQADVAVMEQGGDVLDLLVAAEQRGSERRGVDAHRTIVTILRRQVARAGGSGICPMRRPPPAVIVGVDVSTRAGVDRCRHLPRAPPPDRAGFVAVGL